MQQVRKIGNAYCYFSDRNNGVSNAPYDSLNIGSHVGDDTVSVLKNREILQSLISEQLSVADHRNWIFLNQTHEPNVFSVDEGNYNPLEPPKADASFTTQKDLPLVVMTADCGPLVVSGESVLAVIHASWKTVSSGLISKTIGLMRKACGDEKLYSFLGPCIYPHSYEFDQDLLNDLSKKMGDHIVGKTKSGAPAFNLPAAIKYECESIDVDFDEIGINTFGSPNHFSYRRDNVTGRQGVVAWLT